MIHLFLNKNHILFIKKNFCLIIKFLIVLRHDFCLQLVFMC